MKIPSVYFRENWREIYRQSREHLDNLNYNIHKLWDIRIMASIVCLDTGSGNNINKGFNSRYGSYVIHMNDEDEFFRGLVEPAIADWENREGRLTQDGYYLYLCSTFEITIRFTPVASRGILSENVERKI